MASNYRGLISTDSPPSLRRLVLLLYAAVGVLFVVLQYFVGGHAGRRWDLVAVAVLFSIISGLVAWVIHGKSGRGIGELVPPDVASRSGNAIDPRQAEAEHRLLATLIAEMQDSVIVTDDQLRVRLWSGASARMYGWTADGVVSVFNEAAEVRRSREQLTLAIDSSSLGVWDWDLDSDRATYGPQWPALLGYRTDEIEQTTRAWAALVHPEDAAHVKRAFGAHLRGSTPSLEAEYRMLARDGAWRWIHTRGRVVARDDRGRARRVVGTHADVTLRREAEEKLREALSANELLVRDLRDSQERLRLSLSAASQVQWEYDVAREVLSAGLGSELFQDGGSPVFATGAQAWRAKVHPEDRARAWKDVERCLVGEADHYESEYRLQDARGEWRWVRSRGRVTERDAGGRPLRLLGTTTDVTEVHRLQERLVAATRLASVGTLAAGVAHEINNPLASVAGNVSYLLDRLPAGDDVAPTAAERAELRELLGEMKQGTERIAAIVRAMRTLGRPERAEKLDDIDVRAEVLGALQLVRVQLLRRARLEVDVPEGLPRVRARTSELGRVFVNLLTNAAQAIPEGHASQNWISVRARAGDGEVVVEIGDSGAGMSPAVRERIFEPFFTTRQVGQGTGLGLSIVKSIVDAAGGRVEVESEEGLGTVFRVALSVAADP